MITVKVKVQSHTGLVEHGGTHGAKGTYSGHLQRKKQRTQTGDDCICFFLNVVKPHKKPSKSSKNEKKPQYIFPG